jgi:hypothetical protein
VQKLLIFFNNIILKKQKKTKNLGGIGTDAIKKNTLQITKKKPNHLKNLQYQNKQQLL